MNPYYSLKKYRSINMLTPITKSLKKLTNILASIVAFHFTLTEGSIDHPAG